MSLTNDPRDPRLGRGAGGKGMNGAYLVLPEEARREQGYVRPLRRSYLHTVCGTITTMGQAIAETYARNPRFYGATYCCGCQTHRPVGEHGEFVWIGEDGNPTVEKVGT